MFFDKIKELLPEPAGVKPNKFTRAMGKLIQVAREEAGISQEELAKSIYKRRTTLSEIENGKADVDSFTLALLGAYLKKPLTYFYPHYLQEVFKKDELDPLEHELLLHFEQIHGEELQKLAIRFIKIFGEYNPSNLVIELADHVAAEIEHEKEIKEFAENRNKSK